MNIHGIFQCSKFSIKVRGLAIPFTIQAEKNLRMDIFDVSILLKFTVKFNTEANWKYLIYIFFIFLCDNIKFDEFNRLCFLHNLDAI